MITCNIEPHISETNATGHIDNAAIPVWLERARSPIYRIFNPDLSPADWNMIIRRIEIDFIHEIQFQDIVTIHSYVQEIRNTSFSVVQELFQDQILTAKGIVVLVYYNYSRHQKMEITGVARERLQGMVK